MMKNTTRSCNFSSIVVGTLMILLTIMFPTAHGLIPYNTPSNMWDMMTMMNSIDQDPFRILEQSPLTVPPRSTDQPSLALARADWKETPQAHLISLDLPGMKKEDVKIEVEENRVLRISGERKTTIEDEKEVEGEKWHRVERVAGKFWRQFRLPHNADLDSIKAHLEHGVLKITIPKLAEERKRQPKVVNIVDQEYPSGGQDIKATKTAELK